LKGGIYRLKGNKQQRKKRKKERVSESNGGKRGDEMRERICSVDMSGTRTLHLFP
jgi:hypothetical protein